MESVLTSFDAFVTSERELYDGEDNNRVAFSLAQISRYLDFVEIARSRHLGASRELAERVRKQMEGAKVNRGSRTLTPEKMVEFDNCVRAQQFLHYETESFFLFAKILLDKIARFVGDFFGPSQRVSLRSHDKLCKWFLAYVTAKKLKIPPAMYDTMMELRSTVADFRDKQITHLQNPRTLYGFSGCGDGSARMMVGTLYPTAQEEFSHSPSVGHVCSVLENYVKQIQCLVETNRTRSRYKLADKG